jgi:hypothetical protein
MSSAQYCRTDLVSVALPVWRMEVSAAKRLWVLERENAELKRLVGELTLDNRILKDVLGKKW